LYPGTDAELIWSYAQACGAWLKFSRIGDVVIIFDSRNSASSLFALCWAESIGLTRKEAWYDRECNRVL